MRAIWKQFHKGGQLPIPSGFTTTLGTLSVPLGFYVVFAKTDIMVHPSVDTLAHVQVELRFKNIDGHLFDDSTTHQWANPRTSNHRMETITLNIGVRHVLPPDFPPIGGTPVLGEIELVAFANQDNVITASNVTMTAFMFNELDDEFPV